VGKGGCVACQWVAALRACGGRRVAEAGREEVAARGGGLGAASVDGRVGAGRKVGWRPAI